MGDRTGIEWTDATWNPTTGCDRVSAGCDNCYALTMAGRLKTMGSAHYQTDGDPRTSGPGFGVAVHEDALALPLRWRRPRRVFVNSMSDLFHARVPVEFVARVFAVMAATPQHTYQILTKRPERAQRMLTDLCRCGAGHAAGVHFRSAMSWAASRANPDRVAGMPDDAGSQVYHEAGWPLRNVWLGTSVEDQEQAGRRIPHLFGTPAAVRWVSAEPLLGPVDLEPWLHVPGCLWADRSTCTCHITAGPRLDWVVVGGESGPRARPMRPEWALSLRDQTRNSMAAFCFKQWGDVVWDADHLPDDTVRAIDARWNLSTPVPWPLRVGKKAAGRMLDGRTWDQYPDTLGPEPFPRQYPNTAKAGAR